MPARSGAVNSVPAAPGAPSRAPAHDGHIKCCMGAADTTRPGSPDRRLANTPANQGTKPALTGRVVASGVSGDATSTYPGPATIQGSAPARASVSVRAAPVASSE